MGGSRGSGSNEKDPSKTPKKSHKKSSSSSGSNKGSTSKRQKTSKEPKQDPEASAAASNPDQESYPDAPSRTEQQLAQNVEVRPITPLHDKERPRYIGGFGLPGSGASASNTTYNRDMNESVQYQSASNPNYTHTAWPTTSAPSSASQYSYDDSGSSAQFWRPEPGQDEDAPGDQ